MIDASFGFEMETFEFLNILQIHGFPKVMGVLTHLDSFRDSKRLKKTKKALKQRFWTEIAQGAKLFYLSGMIHGQYLKKEIHNLSLYISRMKFRPLTWRTSHPHVLVDRYEVRVACAMPRRKRHMRSLTHRLLLVALLSLTVDLAFCLLAFQDITPPAILQSNPNTNRRVVMFGYLRGTNLRANTTVHICGAGDFNLNSVREMQDPCPLPDRDPEKKNARRSLNDKETMLCVLQPPSGIACCAVLCVSTGGRTVVSCLDPDGTHLLLAGMLPWPTLVPSALMRTQCILTCPKSTSPTKSQWWRMVTTNAFRCNQSKQRRSARATTLLAWTTSIWMLTAVRVGPCCACFAAVFVVSCPHLGFATHWTVAFFSLPLSLGPQTRMTWV